MPGRKITTFIDGREIPESEVLDWEFTRMKAAWRKLLDIEDAGFSPEFPSWIENRDLNKMREDILKVKMNLGMNYLKRFLVKDWAFGNTMSRIAADLSFGKRKYSITEFLVEGEDLTPEKAAEKINEIMMVNTMQHEAINLNTNPDHYVLRKVADGSQEVIEYTGGSPFPTNFFAHYGDMEGLKSELTEGYTVQIAGCARLSDGFVIGGIRHQIRQEENGIRFKALVEFPALLPDYFIRQHQYHLACEFGHWLSEL